MTDEPLIVRQLREPLTDATRKISRELLICSAIGLVVVHAGLAPTRISALGIELTPSNQAFFRYVIAGVVLYLTATFIINIASEIIAWGTLFKPLEIEEFRERLNAAHEAAESALENLEALRGGVEAARGRVEAASTEVERAGAREALVRRLSEAHALQEEVQVAKIVDLSNLRDARPWIVRAMGNVLLLSQPMRTLRIVFEVVVPLVLAAVSVWSLLWVR